MTSRIARLTVTLAFAVVAFPVGFVSAATRPIAVAAPVGSASDAPLPACRHRDIPTARDAFSQHATTLLDTTFRLPRTYRPTDLTPTNLTGGGLIRRTAHADLQAMDRAARAAGARFAVVSAFRSFGQQATMFNRRVSLVGRAAALGAVARPGHSEHQLGTAIDFRSFDHRTPFATTRAGAWMRTNAWKYGWVMSYPRGKIALTCYSYEPWHFRYVGRVEARLIHASGLTPRQWIWRELGG